MPSFDLTFNAVAGSLHFPPDVAGVRVGSLDGDLAFQPSQSPTGPNTWPVTPRIRGGVEVRIDGPAAAELLASTGLEEGQYLVLGAMKDGWVTSKRHVPTPMQEKPSKIWPTARLWRLEGIVAVQGDAGSLDLNFSQTENKEAGWEFVALVDAPDAQAEARAKATAFKFWQWCSANLARDQWNLQAEQRSIARMDIGVNGVRTQTMRSSIQLTLTLTNEQDATQFKLSQP